MSSTDSKPRRGRRALRGAGKVTLEMVAQAAGVSAASVSRILNGTASVSAEKRAAVDEAIARLGFVPNPVARGLAGGRTFSVGVITQAIDSPFYGGALRGIEDHLGAAGYSPLFVSGQWDATREQACIEALCSRRVDGIIVLSGRSSDAALTRLAREMPVVVTGRALKAPGLYALHFDDRSGAQLATQHLLELGHRDIAFIGGDPKHPDAAERQRGYQAALASAGLAPQADLVLPGAFTEESGSEAIERLLASGRSFSAVLAANDQMAFGAALALHRHGLHVPHDVSLVGFDDLASASYTVPPLTTVHHPVYELGQSAAQAMTQLLAGEQPTLALSEPRLVVRESTLALAARKRQRR